MATLHVTVGREITFTSSPDLPADFRRAIAADNTFPNPLHEKKPKLPPTVQAYYYNPITKEVALPRSYWPQLVARAAEFGVELTAVDTREDLPPVIQRQVAVAVDEIPLGLSILQEMIGGSLPTDWPVIDIRVIVTRHSPLTTEEPARSKEQPKQEPFPWEVDGRAD
jgi:hypothetical protein